MSSDKIKYSSAIISLHGFRITGNDLEIFREKYNRREIVFSHLPRFTINKNENANNRPILAEYYLQFTGKGDDDEYILFDIATEDRALEEEILQVGVEDLFKDEDFLEIFNDVSDKFRTYKDHLNHLDPPIYLIADMYWECWTDHEGGTDSEFSIEITGYLSRYSLEKVIFQKHKK